MTIDEQTLEKNLPSRVVVLFLIALLALAVFQSSALVTLTYDLAPGPLTETIVKGAETWNGWMQNVGTTGVTEAITEWVLQLHDHIIEEW